MPDHHGQTVRVLRIWSIDRIGVSLTLTQLRDSPLEWEQPTLTAAADVAERARRMAARATESHHRCAWGRVWRVEQRLLPPLRAIARFSVSRRVTSEILDTATSHGLAVRRRGCARTIYVGVPTHGERRHRRPGVRQHSEGASWSAPTGQAGRSPPSTCIWLLPPRRLVERTLHLHRRSGGGKYSRPRPGGLRTDRPSAADQ